MGVFSFWEYVCPFSFILFVMNLIKCKFHAESIEIYPILYTVRLATTGVCVFVRRLRLSHFLFFAVMRFICKKQRLRFTATQNQNTGHAKGVSHRFSDCRILLKALVFSDCNFHFLLFHYYFLPQNSREYFR